MALDTVPESTIMESTTISGASGSRPRCATSIPLPPFLSSTALMLEDPTSRPTIVFDPNPNMCPPLRLPGSLSGCLRFLSALRFHLAGLLFHPLVELRFLEAPAVAQLESGNLLLAYILVERVRTHSQVLRSLANIHDFPRVGHSFQTLSTDLRPLAACRHWPKLGRIPRTKLGSSEFRCPEHISALNAHELKANFRDFPCFLPVFRKVTKRGVEGGPIYGMILTSVHNMK